MSPLRKKAAAKLPIVASDAALLGDKDRRAVWREGIVHLHLGRLKIPVIYPHLSDPRLIQITALTIFAFLGQTTYGFAISPEQILTVVLGSALIDTLVMLLRRGVIIFPASGLIAGLGLAMLLRLSPDTPTYPIYFLAAALAVLSKQLLTVKTETGRRHIFNPSNFGLCCVLLLFPTIAFVTPDQWNPSPTLLMVLTLLGVLLVVRAKVAALTAIFIVAETALYFVHQGSLSLNPLWILNNSADYWFRTPTLLVFTFHMVTDPRTMPRTQTERALFACIVAILHWILLAADFGRTSIFFALIATYAGYALLLTGNRLVAKMRA